ncbi:sulfite exporter TauE/SafE family protein [Variovorax sp. LjRoot84]|uniref:sulfite exporter TauE/SafE family protein n=1 Tax=Variovorax sp. LjRoot84 TaxID=3342340 RepID=UPI003ECF7130
MQTALASTALLMGLVGGPHCVAMCGAACAGVIRIVRVPVDGGVAPLSASPPAVSASVAFHAARIAGYTAAGAAAAAAMQSLGFASEQVAALRPLWVLLHVFVLAWGLVLAALGRQPLWAHRIGRALATRLRPLTGSMAGVLATGALWVSMPCGLLYSALMLAGLANGPAQGALTMALFAVGSGVSLVLAPWLWQRLRSGASIARKEWGTRLAGGLLAAVAIPALWIDLSHQIDIWCR